MYNECRHILSGGHKCRAAALRGKAFCYYHIASRRLSKIVTTSASNLVLPSVEDPAGIITSINQVLSTYGKHYIDHHQAGVYLYGLQIAASLARKTASDQKPSETVRDLCDDPVHGVIAPENSVCEPPGDCRTCPKIDTCKRGQATESLGDTQKRYYRMAERAREAGKQKSDSPSADESPTTGTENSAIGSESAGMDADPSTAGTAAPAANEMPPIDVVPEFPGCEENRDLLREYFGGTVPPKYMCLYERKPEPAGSDPTPRTP